jgi:hypothetical protein
MTQTSLSLSDAEFLEKNPAELLAETDEKPADQEIESSNQTDEDKVATSEEEVSEAQEQTEETVTEEVSQPDGDTQREPEPFSDTTSTESLDTSKKDSTETKGDTPETTEFDYESAYKKVSEPFKANGTDMQVKDPEDIVRLMQMGANYQKKMAQLKPNLKLIKMLEKNELLDEVKLHNLIDLSKKDPKAIAKLIEESDIDPLDINKDVPTDYQPTDYTVTDKEYNLDAVLDEIKDSETFTKTINVVTKDWDIESKNTITNYPEIISVIDSHMNNGVFETVNAKLQQDKALGKLVGVSDVDAYRNISEQLFKEGVLVDKKPGASSEVSNVSSKTDEKANADRNKKRKAVAPVKQTTTKKAASDEDFLGLSDEAFMKKYAVR